MTILKLKLTFLDEVLGTASNKRDIHERYIASKSQNQVKIEEEVLSVEEVVNNEMTVFSRDKDDRPIMWDYQIKGYIKEACGALRDLAGKDEVTGKKKKAITACGNLPAYKTKIDKNVFIYPRQIPFMNFDISDMGNCQRPLRADTAQGPRIALANSETIPAGATLDFEILCMNDDHVKAIEECLYYGLFKGTGQWRNSGKGRFDIDDIEYEQVSVTMLMDSDFRKKWKEALVNL